MYSVGRTLKLSHLPVITLVLVKGKRAGYRDERLQRRDVGSERFDDFIALSSHAISDLPRPPVSATQVLATSSQRPHYSGRFILPTSATPWRHQQTLRQNPCLGYPPSPSPEARIVQQRSPASSRSCPTNLPVHYSQPHLKCQPHLLRQVVAVLSGPRSRLRRCNRRLRLGDGTSFRRVMVRRRTVMTMR
jgi:hypothetical protein